MHVGSSSVASPTLRSVLRVIGVARWLSWLWMLAVVVFSGDGLRRPWLAWLLVAAGLAICAATTWCLARRSHLLVARPLLIVEAVFALGASALDGAAFEPGHVFATSQNLAAQWPAVAAAAIAVAAGPVVAASYGLLAGPVRWVGARLNGFDDFEPRHLVSLAALSAFAAAIGGVIGWLCRLLRRAEAEIADRRARDEVAAVLHDTVLQTLAQVERRTAASDPELAAAALASDRALRRFLFGPADEAADLHARLVSAVDAASARWPSEARIVVNVVDTGCRLPPRHQDALAGAVGEAVANALEHASATDVVVFAETDDDGHVFCTIRDDGCGFDLTDGTRARTGLRISILERLEAIGGHADIATAPGRGTEVRLRTAPA